MAIVAVMHSIYAVPGASPQQTSLSLPESPRRPTLHSVNSRSTLSPHYGRFDAFHAMSFGSLSDITAFADRVEKLYNYGWSNVRNPAAQYHEFGQDIHRLYENIGQVENVFHSVQARCIKTIPLNHSFHDVFSLNNILEEPFKTIKDCRELLRRRDIFSEERGAIKNIYWNVLVEVDVSQLHAKIKNHNVKIIALLKPLEIKLLLDVKGLVYDNGDGLLLKLAEIEAKLFGEGKLLSLKIAIQCSQIQIPQYLRDRFEDASIAEKPQLKEGGPFPIHQGLTAFLLHYKEDIASGGFLLEEPTQTPEQYLRMMKTIWIMQRIQNSKEYTQARKAGNRLLICFVESLAQNCLDGFNRFAGPTSEKSFKIRTEPDPVSLNQLEEDSFAIWPRSVQPLDIFDTASMDSLKLVFRALLRPPPMQTLSPTLSRYRQLLLLRHDNTLLEMITKETSENDASTNSQSKTLDLATVSLNPIYADPDNELQAAMDMGLNTMGNRGSDDHLSFQSYNDLYFFQEAITGYRPILDLLDVDVRIHHDSLTQWKARMQLWNIQVVHNTTDQQQDLSPTSSRRPSLVPSVAPSSYQTSPTSQYSSTTSFQTRTSQVTAVTSFEEAEDEVGMSIDATTFEPPKQPLLVLFLRPRGERLPLEQLGHMTLMKIPMSQKSVILDTKNCSCRPTKKCDCTHSELTGVQKKFMGKKPLLVQRYQSQEQLNLALLGAHHDRRGGQGEEKLNFVSFTFSSVRDREVFDAHFREYQRLYARRMDSYEREKRSIRFRRDAPGPS